MKDDKWGILLFAGLLFGIFLMARNPQQAVTSQQPRYIVTPMEPDGEPTLTPSRTYENEEVREISYNELGLPTRIVITRHARAA